MAVEATERDDFRSDRWIEAIEAPAEDGQMALKQTLDPRRPPHVDAKQMKEPRGACTFTPSASKRAGRRRFTQKDT